MDPVTSARPTTPNARGYAETLSMSAVAPRPRSGPPLAATARKGRERGAFQMRALRRARMARRA
jgi:hypothetical protein